MLPNYDLWWKVMEFLMYSPTQTLLYLLSFPPTSLTYLWCSLQYPVPSSLEIEFGSAVFTHNLTSASNLHLNKLQKIFSQGVCFMKNTFLEPFTNKLPHVCLILEILINKKWFTVKLRKKPTVFGNEVILYFFKKNRK